ASQNIIRFFTTLNRDSPATMEIIHRLSDTHIEQLHRLYQNEWWCEGRTPEETRRCVQFSQLNFAMVEDDALVAFARVLSDFTFKALIFDLIVAPPHRGMGFGKHLLGAVLEHSRLQKVKHFELYCTPGMQPFYQRYGFSHTADDIQLMRLDRSTL
ncbi:MAG: GNAT family N-acetyltransferase, partial [bacterium]